MADSVYIESSVASYLTARPSHNVVTAARQAITIDWWRDRRQDFEIFISALVEEEISRGDAEAARSRLEMVADVASIAITPQAEELAEQLIISNAVPNSNIEDALHIAIAAAQGMGYLLTWNFKHINNAQSRATITMVVEDHGYICPEMCSPEERGA